MLVLEETPEAVPPRPLNTGVGVDEPETLETADEPPPRPELVYLVRGRVTSREGPLDGAFVSLTTHGERALHVWARTEEDGTFEVADVEPETYLLNVGYGEGGRVHQEWVDVDGDLDLDLHLGMARLSGRVVDTATGEGLPGVYLRLVPVDQNKPNEDGVTVVSSHAFPTLTSDIDGRFAIGPLQEGRWKLKVDAGEYVEKEVGFEIRDGVDATGVLFELHRAARLSVEVKTALGVVPEKVTAKLTDGGGTTVAETTLHFSYGSQAAWYGVPPGDYELTLSTVLGARAEARVAARAGEVTEVSVELPSVANSTPACRTDS